jgi:uncharacterized iron-regulated membrane protein
MPGDSGVARRATARSLALRAHRRVGLSLALFLTIAGLSGAVIAFTDELDTWLNPQLRLSRADAGWQVSPYGVIERLQAEDPRARITHASLVVPPGRSALFFAKPRRDPRTGQLYALGYNQIYVDPQDGTVLGRRHWGAFTVDRLHFIPWVYEIHYSLFLPEMLSGWFLGLLAAAWAADCFVGAWLTLPRSPPLWQGWRRAWRLKRGAGAHRRTVDIHRAGGLWLWGGLLMLALTGFYLRVGEHTVRPLLASLSAITQSPIEQRPERPDNDPAEPELSFSAAVDIARAHALHQGRDSIAASASFDPGSGIYIVMFPGRASQGFGIDAAMRYVDGASGAYLGEAEPLGGTLADKILDLPRPLHTGRIAGLAGKAFVAACGLATAVLSITGVLIWARKRRARARAAPEGGV